MFGKKKEKGPPGLRVPAPPVPSPSRSDTSQIKENIGNVSKRTMRDIGAQRRDFDSGPLLPPPPGNLTDPLDFDLPPKRKGSPVPRGVPPKHPSPAPPEHKHARHIKHERHESARPSPPLFIKIEKYRSLVSNINELKSYALSLRDALDALSDIEKELKNGLNVTQNALDKFNSIVAELDTKLLRVTSEDGDHVNTLPQDMDDYVKNLYDNIERIKHELRNIKE
jgi:hypothetical protein